MKIFILVTLLLFAAIEAKTLLFPIPQNVSWTGSMNELSNNFDIKGAKNVHVQNAARRYHRLILKERWVPVQVTPKQTLKQGGDLHTLLIDVKDNQVKLDAGINESYSLHVPSKGGQATLTANTWVGALRGLETFSQLVQAKDGKRNGPLVAHSVDISDSPRYEHRGILLDTSRNFYPVKHLLRTIDAQAFNKMNVLHWHATDSQSWPFYFKSHPELSKKGAYSPQETYSLKDVQTVIRYGESRGVRIVLEIDMPAHTASIGESHPDYIICGDEFWSAYAAEPPAGQLDPLNKEAFELVKDIVKEATERFPDRLYHTGGDEINTACWELDEGIKSYTQQRNITTKEVWFEWTTKLLKYVTETLKKTPIIWEDPVRDGGRYANNTVIQTWLAAPSIYTKMGHDVIVSNYDYFYLDCGHGGWVGNDPRYISPNQTESPNDLFNYGGVGGSWCAPFKTWQRIYSYDLTFGIEPSHTGRVLGGEVAVWSEQTGPTVLEPRLWPRSAAAAELYWSGSYDDGGIRRTVQTVSERFYDWVYRLQARGINAEPVQPKYCALHPNACDLNDPKTL